MILKQEKNNQGWSTWIEIDKDNSLFFITDYQITEEEAKNIRDKYIQEHLYDDVQKIDVDINKETLKKAVTFLLNNSNDDFIKYLSTLSEKDACLIKYFFSEVSDALVQRGELSSKEADYITQLKTFLANQPARKIDKLLFGE